MPEQFGGCLTQPDRCKIQYNIYADICQSIERLTSAEQVKCVVTKRGEYPKTAKDAIKGIYLGASPEPHPQQAAGY